MPLRYDKNKHTLKEQQLIIKYHTYPDFKSLDAPDQALMKLAIEARGNAYAPYSNFQVGAAVALENGEVVLGNNQENASYPSGLCAERVAIFHAGANNPGLTIKAIAITATSKKYVVKEAAAPCGNCRQAIMEYEQKQQSPIRIMLMGEVGEVIVFNSLSTILPFAFTNSFL